MNDFALKTLCDAAREAFRRGDAFGTTGNLSVRVDDVVWTTPAYASLENLSPLDLACVGLDGEPRGVNRATLELPLHLAVYEMRPEVTAVVHLHAPYTVALSCLAELDEAGPLPPLTPGFQSLVAPLGVVPYLRPGSSELTAAVRNLIRRHNCLLLRNHGLVCVSRTLQRSIERAVELEQTARLFFLLRGCDFRPLSNAEVNEINATSRSSPPA